jgi:hypothetical protein
MEHFLCYSLVLSHRNVQLGTWDTTSTFQSQSDSNSSLSLVDWIHLVPDREGRGQSPESGRMDVLIPLLDDLRHIPGSVGISTGTTSGPKRETLIRDFDFPLDLPLHILSNDGRDMQCLCRHLYFSDALFHGFAKRGTLFFHLRHGSGSSHNDCKNFHSCGSTSWRISVYKYISMLEDIVFGP